MTRVDTKALAVFSDFLQRNTSLRDLLGDVARFQVVIDANFVIADLMYRVKFPDRGNTMLHELVAAKVFEIWAPTWLESELASAIPRVAKKRGLRLDSMLLEWASYRTNLKWMDVSQCPTESVQETRDPNDLPYVLLEKELNAHGVLSKDRDVRAMARTCLDDTFVMTARRYARARVVTLTIRFAGVIIPAIAIELLMVLVGTFRRLPPAVQIATVAVITTFLLSSKGRRFLSNLPNQFRRAMSSLAEAVAPLQHLAQAMQVESDKELIALQGAIGPRSTEQCHFQTVSAT